MEVAIKINGTKEITLNPETPLEHEYLPLIKDSEKYLVTREPNSNKLILKLIKEEKMNRNDKIQSIDSKCQKLADTATRKKMFGKYDIDEGSEEWKQIYADGDGTIFTPKALDIYNTWYKYYFDILSSEIID